MMACMGRLCPKGPQVYERVEISPVEVDTKPPSTHALGSDSLYFNKNT